MPPQWLLSQAHTTSLNNSLQGPHLHQFLQKLLHPMILRLTPLQIHPHPFRILRHMNHHAQTPATRVIRHHHTEILFQKNIIDLLPATVQHGMITHGGMTPPTTTVATLPLRKDVLAVDIVKGAPEPTATTTPPHGPDGDLYDIVDLLIPWLSRFLE